MLGSSDKFTNLNGAERLCVNGIQREALHGNKISHLDVKGLEDKPKPATAYLSADLLNEKANTSSSQTVSTNSIFFLSNLLGD